LGDIFYQTRYLSHASPDGIVLGD